MQSRSCLLVLVLSLIVVKVSLGVLTDWTGAGATDLWSDPCNWSERLPQADDTARLVLGGGTTVVDATTHASFWQLQVGMESGAAATLDIMGGDIGGTLTFTNSGLWGMIVGCTVDTPDSYGEGIVNQAGGVVTSSVSMIGVLLGGKGTAYGEYNMYSGIFNSPGALSVAECAANSPGHLQVDGGLVQAGMLVSRTGASIDIKEGTLQVISAFDPETGAPSSTPTEAAAIINQWVGNGRLTAYDGKGTVVVEPNDVLGYVLVTAANDYTTTDFAPANGRVVNVAEFSELTWTNPAGITGVDVWLNTDPDVTSGTKLKDNELVSSAVVGSLVAGNTYFWRVDTHHPTEGTTVGAVRVFYVPNCADALEDGRSLALDVSGPEGVPDCTIDVYDFAVFAGQWLDCTDPANPNCDFTFYGL